MNKKTILALGIVALALAGSASARIDFPPTNTIPSSTVAGLPACAAALRGRMYLVTDALTPLALAAVTGGGAVVVPVVCNATAWIVF